MSAAMPGGRQGMFAALSRIAALAGEVGRPSDPSARGTPLRTSHLVAAVLLFGPAYGAVMGSFAFSFSNRLLLIVYSAVKVPLLLLLTAAICLPGFFVINTVLRLRADLREAFAAIFAGQAALAMALASLAPVTRFLYFCGIDHRWALLCNAGMFALATVAGQIVIHRRYRPLIARSGRHRIMLWVWVTMYAFVGIQLGWMLRPFVGTPGIAVTFVRDEPFSNAYVAVAKLFVPPAE